MLIIMKANKLSINGTKQLKVFLYDTLALTGNMRCMLQGRLAAFPTGPDSTHAQGNRLLQFWCRNLMSVCWAYKNNTS